MRALLFIVAATIFEAVGDAIMRIALRSGNSPKRVLFFVLATVLLASYGASLNLAPIKFAEATGIYIGSLFIMFQLADYIFFKQTPTPAVMTGGAFIVVGSAIIGWWR